MKWLSVLPLTVVMVAGPQIIGAIFLAASREAKRSLVRTCVVVRPPFELVALVARRPLAEEIGVRRWPGWTHGNVAFSHRG